MSSLLLGQVDIIAREELRSTSQAGDKDLWKSMNTFHIYLHSFTIVVLDEKDIECEISCKIKHFHEVPGWRNWQTQRTQNPPVLSTLGVQLPLPAP
jgi:hypothetical protein